MFDPQKRSKNRIPKNFIGHLEAIEAIFSNFRRESTKIRFYKGITRAEFLIYSNIAAEKDLL